MLQGWLKDLASDQQENGGSITPILFPNINGGYIQDAARNLERLCDSNAM